MFLPSIVKHHNGYKEFQKDLLDSLLLENLHLKSFGLAVVEELEQENLFDYDDLCYF
jgi:hypothetical protein